MTKDPKNKLIVIAEDSLTQAENVKYILESKGYRVACGRNGKEALKLVEEQIPDLVISDIIMPEMNGYELCKSIKTNNDLKNVPVILLTSLADTEDVLKGLECGADNYIIKPFSDEHLILRIRSILTEDKKAGEEKKIQEEIDILFEGKKYFFNSTKFKILNMLLSTYEGAVQKTRKLEETQYTLNELRNSLEHKVKERTQDLQQKIHERQTIESAITESEKKYRHLVENAMIGVFSLSVDGLILFANKALTTLLNNQTGKELLSNTFQSFCHHSGEYDHFLKLLNQDGQVVDYESELITESGEIKSVIINARLREDNISGILLDITERKKIIEKEQKYQEELKIAKEKAEESDRVKSAFLSNMSHEIRTPLNAISGFSCLLCDPDLTGGNKKEFIHRITDGCDTLLNLINNILDLAKLEAGKIKLNKRKSLLNKLLETMYSLYLNGMEKQGKSHLSFKLLKTSPDENFTIITDPDRIFQVLSNLIDNALKFTENGSVDFGYEIRDDQLLFFVKDTGPGISEAQKKIIFERFRKAEESKTKLYGGAGLGLAICNRLVQLMEGEIWVESEPGQGASFFFTVPFVLSELVKDVEQKNKPPIHEQSLKGKKILVAEDNHLNYQLIEAFLAGTDLNIAWAKDGKEAFDYCKSSGDVDMVLMDLRMPVMDGFEATKKIRNINKDLPVVAVTAFAISEEKERAEETGFTDYLTKPVNREKLVQTIHKYIFRG